MCRIEIIFFACGHTHDISADCEFAQVSGPFFNKYACVNYINGNRHVGEQCGKHMGFYCGRTQNGVVIDRIRILRENMQTKLLDKVAERECVNASWETYRSETVARGHSLDNLVSISTYRNIDQQRNKLIGECDLIQARANYLDGLYHHAYNNRHLLAPGARYQPMFDGTNFDFDASIFTAQMLSLIKRGIGIQPSLRLVTTPASNVNAQNQHQPLSQSMPPQTNVNATGVQSLQQRTSTPTMPPSMTPKKQAGSEYQISLMGEDIIRGLTPEGETVAEKAARYLQQFRTARGQKMADSMAKQGYDVEGQGIRPAPKMGSRRPRQPKPTPPRNTGSAMTAPKRADSSVTPTKVRRSARNINKEPKYTESPIASDLGQSPEASSPDKSDAAWNESPGRSEASWSPTRQTKGGVSRGRRTTLNSPGSIASSPARTQIMLSNKILDFKKGNGDTGTAGSAQLQVAGPSLDQAFRSRHASLSQQPPPIDSPQLSHVSSGFNQSNQLQHGMNTFNTYGQLGHGPYACSPVEGYVQQSPGALPEIDPRSAAMQRSSFLAQQLGRSLQQQQLAAGIIGTPATRVSSSPQMRQQGMAPGMAYNPHATHAQVSSAASPYMVPARGGSQPFSAYQMPPPNLFHHNYQQSMAGQAASPSSPVARSFSTGALPVSGLHNHPGQDVSMPTLDSNFQPPATAHPDYESMRRSFSSATHLTPQSSFVGNQAVPNSEPVKRSMPPASPTGVRKRVRLSLPGQNEAPTLEPSASNFQLHAPAGLPATYSTSSFAAIEACERENADEIAAMSVHYPISDPQHPATSYEAAQTLADMHSTTSMVDASDQFATFPTSVPQHSGPSYDAAQILADMHSSTNMIDAKNQFPELGHTTQQYHQAESTTAHDTQQEAQEPLSEPDWSLINDDENPFQMP